MSQVLARVRHLFDLYCDPAAVDETLAVMNGLTLGYMFREPVCPAVLTLTSWRCGQRWEGKFS
ncbi:MAG: AlkA N-terminal domain-containing protein [Akkermansia sp.]